MAPDAHGVRPAPDAWAGITFTDRATVPYARQATEAIAAWLRALATTPRPTEAWRTWFWHGHLATSLDKVKSPATMVQQVRLLQRLGGGRFPALLRAVAVDPAMLIWLDGRDNIRATPNENFGREVMELFALGVGTHTEADVAAAASALSGWALVKGEPAGSRFVARRHDPTPRRFLGRTVTDLDGVLGAITAQPACPTFVARSLARAILGDAADAGLVADLARRFASAGLDVAVLLRATLEAGLARAAETDAGAAQVVVAPVPWLAAALRATGATVAPRLLLRSLEAAGQVPMRPPNVGGWPDGPAWLATSTVVARYDLAGLVAAATPATSLLRRAAASGDDDTLADLLLRPAGFAAGTRSALADARRAGGPAGVAPLAIALASPDLMVA